jgi:O-antigen ligase
MIALAYVALWGFVFTIPWENVVVIHGVGAISRLLGMVAVGFALLAVVVTGRFRRWHLVHVAALLFLVWSGCNYLFFGGTDSISKKFLTYVQLVVVLWMVWELAVSRSRQLNLLVAYVLGAYVAAFDTILVYRHHAGGVRRFAAEGFDPNDLAMALALAIPMAWYIGMTHRRVLVRWAGRAYLPIGLMAIGLTASRGGMLASVVALLIIPMTMTKLSPQRLATIMVMVCLAGALAVAYIPSTVLTRLESTRSEVAGGRLGGRGKIWVAGVRAFTLRPLAGYGPGAFKSAVRPSLGSLSQVAHNTFLSVLVEEGLIGFILFMTMFVSVFRAIRRLPLLERRFTLSLMATLGVAMLPLSWDDNKSVWFVLAALLGFATAFASTYVPAAASDGHDLQSRWRPALARMPRGVGVGSRQGLRAPTGGAPPERP